MYSFDISILAYHNSLHAGATLPIFHNCTPRSYNPKLCIICVTKLISLLFVYLRDLFYSFILSYTAFGYNYKLFLVKTALIAL